jgi:hypothetical protein
MAPGCAQSTLGLQNLCVYTCDNLEI